MLKNGEGADLPDSGSEYWWEDTYADFLGVSGTG